MPVVLIVNGNSYNYPTSGEDPQWGEVAAAWAEAVTNQLASISNGDDILPTEVDILNNVAVATDISGLFLNPSTVRSAEINYNIRRTSTTNTSGKAESGNITAVYDNNATAGNKWLMRQDANGTAGVSFSITDAGQFQYTSTDIGSGSYAGTISFSAKVKNQ
jgi:hypothetical protein